MADLHRTRSRTRLQEESDKLSELVAARAAGDERRCSIVEESVTVAYLPIAGIIARRYRHRGVDFDDLEQVARLGLVKAVRRWRPERGAFLAYAMPTIEGELKRHFRDSGSTIRIPRQLYESQPRVTAAQRALRQEASREPTLAEIADRAGIPEQQVRDVLTASHACQPLSTDDGLDAAEGLRSADAERDLSMVALRARLRPALRALPEQQRRIVALRFIWGQSQLQIANALGVSQMQISRLLRSALDRLSEYMAATDSRHTRPA